MMKRKGLSVLCVAVATLVVGVPAWAQNKKEADEQERSIKETEVPASALATLKRLDALAVMHPPFAHH